ncbi:hypothetical protein RF55_14314 [Lasius niger]|uniref:Uncharacterized protein n=1 Tax=Lasius niger TaxID=67767 RepID=A0A0J7K8N1_LASNI|nr:hypothetical protein RF55_14314 [Lasius niger]
MKDKAWKHLEGLKLADPQYHRPGPIDILLGEAVFTSLLRDGRKVGNQGEPDAFNTVFGWVLLGSVSSKVSQPLRLFLTLESIDASVNRFWQLENVPEVSAYSDKDKRGEELFTRTTRREDGRFVVQYPFEKDPPSFVDSRQIAVNRFNSLERRFRRNPDFKNSYAQFMLD